MERQNQVKIKIIMPKYRYYLRKGNTLEEWTGVFDDEASADEWEAKHGEWWRNRGRDLVRIEIKK